MQKIRQKWANMDAIDKQWARVYIVVGIIIIIILVVFGYNYKGAEEKCRVLVRYNTGISGVDKPYYYYMSYDYSRYDSKFVYKADGTSELQVNKDSYAKVKNPFGTRDEAIDACKNDENRVDD